MIQIGHITYSHGLGIPFYSKFVSERALTGNDGKDLVTGVHLQFPPLPVRCGRELTAEISEKLFTSNGSPGILVTPSNLVNLARQDQASRSDLDEKHFFGGLGYYDIAMFTPEIIDLDLSQSEKQNRCRVIGGSNSRGEQFIMTALWGRNNDVLESYEGLQCRPYRLQIQATTPVFLLMIKGADLTNETSWQKIIDHFFHAFGYTLLDEDRFEEFLEDHQSRIEHFFRTIEELTGLQEISGAVSSFWQSNP